MWAAPLSAAAAAVAQGGSGPGRAGPGWSGSGGRRRHRRRERATQRRTEPPPPPPRPGPRGCAAPSRCLRRRSRSRSGHRAGEAGRGRAAGWAGVREGAPSMDSLGLGPGSPPRAAFSSAPSLLPSPPELGRWPTQPGPRPRPGPAPCPQHTNPPSPSCPPGVLLFASHICPCPLSLWLYCPVTSDKSFSAVSITSLPCPQSSIPPTSLPTNFLTAFPVPRNSSCGPVTSSPALMTSHLSLSYPTPSSDPVTPGPFHCPLLPPTHLFICLHYTSLVCLTSPYLGSQIPTHTWLTPCTVTHQHLYSHTTRSSQPHTHIHHWPHTLKHAPSLTDVHKILLHSHFSLHTQASTHPKGAVMGQPSYSCSFQPSLI